MDAELESRLLTLVLQAAKSDWSDAEVGEMVRRYVSLIESSQSAIDVARELDLLRLPKANQQ
jgi:hypothetical protein